MLHNYHTTAINTEVNFSFTYGLTFNLQSQVLHVGPIFENVVLSSISLLLFDVSTMLNLPLDNSFFLSHPWLHDA